MKKTIFHICSKHAWAKAQEEGEYSGDTLITEGFIHCSTPEQVIEVANNLFKGNSDLMLLVIDENGIAPEVKYEDGGNRKLYPHIYGPLNLNAVVKTVDFPVNSDGYFEMPRLE